MKKYRKKPVVVEAIQITPENLPTIRALPESGTDFSIVGHVPRHIDPKDLAFVFETDTIQSSAHWGDWLVRDTDGFLYPCRDSVFQATHEPAE